MKNSIRSKLKKLENFVKRLSRICGLDLRAYHPSRSEAARLGRLLDCNGIDLVLDVGANTGQFAEYLRYVGYTGKIICFEPLSDPYAKLKKLSDNDSGIICAPRMAIGDYDGEVTINIAANHESSSVLKVKEWHSKSELQARFIGCEMVSMRRLDAVVQDYLQGSVRPFLKIDVQGYESRVLDGAAKLLPRLTGLQLELSLMPLYEGELPYRTILDRVEQTGLKLHDLNPCYSDPITGRTLQVDALFFRC